MCRWMSFFLGIGIPFLTSISVFAQDTVENEIRRQFEQHHQSGFREKTFLHTDKEIYFTGEICWFKIYYVDAFFHRPASISKLAYVEVLDGNNNPVLQAKVSLEDNNRSGSFDLPLKLKSGNYKLRAYTNWMKNFEADFYFEKIITILNTKAPALISTDSVKVQPDIQFFPEGGQLVNGMESKIGFRITDQNAKGLDAEILIIGDKGDTVVKTSTLRFGMGSFLLKPLASRSYQARISLPDGSFFTRSLPAISEEGYTINVSEISGTKLEVTVQAKVNDLLSRDIYLFVHNRGSVKILQTSSIKNGIARFNIDKSKLGDGISHFTVFNASRQPVSERLYFKYPLQIFHPEISLSDSVVATRSKIGINISLANEKDDLLAADMSMAVCLADSVQDFNKTTISSYLWLTSDLTGVIESPGYYFDSNNPDREKAMDNLMLVNGWRRFRWNELLPETSSPVFKFAPEYRGHILSGRLAGLDNKAALSGKECLFAVPGSSSYLQSSITDASGGLKFDVKDFYNKGKIIIQTKEKRDSMVRIEVNNPFSNDYTAKILNPPLISPGKWEQLQDSYISTQVQYLYNGSQLKTFGEPLSDTIPFYSKPDATYSLDNYVRFTSMEEVISEYVRPVNIKRRNGRYYLPVLDLPNDKYFETDPLVLLDGVPVLDFDRIMKYDPLKVKTLDVVSRTYFLGQSAFDGIIDLSTYNNNLEGYEMDPDAAIIDYEGLQARREFYSPVYETSQQMQNRLPDFRNLLFWSPVIRMEQNKTKEIKFYVSDLPGKYMVIVQGLTSDGKTGIKSAYFEVRNKSFK